MPCPEASLLAQGLETGSFKPEVEKHVSRCDACAEMLEGLRAELQSLEISIARLWVSERVSCPHPDLIGDYASNALPPPERLYLDFHIRDLRCPHCSSTLEEIESRDRERGEERAARAKKKVEQSTALFFKKK